MRAAVTRAAARGFGAPRVSAFPKAALPALLALILSLCLISCSGGGSAVPDAGEYFFVYDGAGVISGETERYIVAANADLEEKTGAQIVVAAVGTTGTTDIADYAASLFNKWQIGDADLDNGVLVLMSVDEEDYWVTQGSGLEDLLSSGTLKLMLDEHMEPKFAAADYDGAARSMFDALLSFFETAYSVTVEPDYSFEQSGQTQPGTESGEKKTGCLSVSLGVLFLILVILAVGLTLTGIVVIVVAVLRHSGMTGTGGSSSKSPSKENRNPYSQTYSGPREGYEHTRVDYTGSAPYTGHTDGLNPAGRHSYTTSGGTVYTGSSESGNRKSAAADAEQHGFHADVNPYLAQVLASFAGSVLSSMVRGSFLSGSGSSSSRTYGSASKSSGSSKNTTSSGSFGSGTFTGSSKPRSPGNIHVGGWSTSSGGSSHTVRSNRSHSGYSGSFRSSGGSRSYSSGSSRPSGSSRSSGGSRSFSGGGGSSRGGGAGRR